MSKNKITYDAIDELFEFLNGIKKEKIQQKYIDKVKRHFCYDMEEIKNMVYWKIEFEMRSGADQEREGIISDVEYNAILKYKRNVKFDFGEIAKYVYLTSKFVEKDFTKDEKKILEFLESGRPDDDLFECLHCNHKSCRNGGCNFVNIELGKHVGSDIDLNMDSDSNTDSD